MSERYHMSEEFLHRACASIPLGSQTFSKSKTQFPYGVSPYFISHGKGSHVWDIDGNEYIDFVNGLLSVTLGYCDPDVDLAVSEQMKKGVIFSLPHMLEAIVAEKIINMVPCAEMARFGKNGSDATAGAIRLARAYTGREHVIVCGYHGWQDWYVGSTTRDLGVPLSTKLLTHKFQYNDIESLEKVFLEYPDQVAAVIMEPMNIVYPQDNFLNHVKEITHQNGALLIFDETITGFRFSKGGAQELFGVIPDLCTMGKGVANGFPLSVIAGKKEIMMLMEEIFFSFTFGGETLSLAAANIVLDKIQREPVVETLFERGSYLIHKINQLILKHELKDILSISGHPAWSFLVFKDAKPYTSLEIKTLWIQEILKRGILCFGSHNLSYSHSEADIAKILEVYDGVFELLSKNILENSFYMALKCEPIKPLFTVR